MTKDRRTSSPKSMVFPPHCQLAGERCVRVYQNAARVFSAQATHGGAVEYGAQAALGAMRTQSGVRFLIGGGRGPEDRAPR